MRRTLLACLAIGLAVLASSAGAQTTPTEPIVDKGDFKLVHTNPFKQPNKRILKLLLGPGELPGLIAGLNDTFALPHDVRVSLGPGDGPYYDPGARTIRINYDFILYVQQLFKSEGVATKQAELNDISLAITYFVFFHELGHALVDQYDLPITGREEDAVDELATVVVTEFFDAGEMALATALMFDLSS